MKRPKFMKRALRLARPVNGRRKARGPFGFAQQGCLYRAAASPHRIRLGKKVLRAGTYVMISKATTEATK